MEAQMNSILSKIAGNFAKDLKETLKIFANHLAAEWEIDQSRVPEAIASFNAKTVSTKSTNSAKKAKKDPNAPKRPKSAYLFFCDSERPTLKEEGMAFTEIGAMLGKKWKELSDDEKIEYNELFIEDKTRYENEMKDYTPPEGVEIKPKPKVSKSKAVVEPTTKATKAMTKVLEAKEKSEKEGKSFCYNLSTNRILEFHKDKQGDRKFDTDNFVCAKTQDEIDAYLEFMKKEEVNEEEDTTKEEEEEDTTEEEEEDTTEEEEEVVPPPKRQLQPRTEKSKQKPRNRQTN